MAALTRTETAADAVLAGLAAGAVEVIFGNLGSDHPALIEALARARARGEARPAVVLAPHEASALAAAHGYALVTGRAQAVFVHVDVGTANLVGGVHNAARSRVPVLIFAGLTPFTMEGERPGTRTAYPNHLQDVRDQHSLVRPYTKWSYDLRTGANARQIVLRALQIAHSAPQGPVYVTAARETLAETVGTRDVDTALWRPIEPIPAPSAVVQEIASAVAAARFPILVTSALGRTPAAVPLLVELAEILGIGVVEPVAAAVSFPAGHELHLGYNADPLLDRADLIIAIDTDAPWLPARRKPRHDAAVYFIDADPLKQDLPLWYVESRRFVRADSATVLAQLLAAARALSDRGDAIGRRREFAAVHAAQRAAWRAELAEDSLTAATVAHAVAQAIDDDAIVLNEAVSNAEAVFRHLPRSKPGTLFASGGSSLGWSGGAAVGVKLARPEATVVALVGDGTYFLSSPSSTYWMAQRYGTPFLTVILDNGGWNATKQNIIRQHAGGFADAGDQYWVNLAQTADLPGVAAAAGGALAMTVDTLPELRAALARALDTVGRGRPAVVSARLAPISRQAPERPVTGD